jgi:hypothetical protein
MKRRRTNVGIVLSVLLLAAHFRVVRAQEITPEEVQSLAKEAYIFGAPSLRTFSILEPGHVKSDFTR